MTKHRTESTPLSDTDLDDFPQPLTHEHGRWVERPRNLYLQLSRTRYTVGTYDQFGVRVLPHEDENYATVHLRIPHALPASSAAQLATFANQRIPYTDRDRKWDDVLGGGPTSDRNRWSGFVDSVLAAVDFAQAALESAVWAHARGEEWSWPYTPPDRVEKKYELWGDDHPRTYDLETEYEVDLAADVRPGGPTEDDVQF